MMIRLKFINGNVYPIIICDICNQRIEKFDSGMVIYDKPTEEGIIFDPIYVHYGVCEKHINKRITNTDYKTARGQGLTRHFKYLLNNLQLSTKDIENYPID